MVRLEPNFIKPLFSNDGKEKEGEDVVVILRNSPRRTVSQRERHFKVASSYYLKTGRCKNMRSVVQRCGRHIQLFY